MRLSYALPLVCIGFLWGTTAGCLIGVKPTMACGDGYVDREAGEECDPHDPDDWDFVHACETVGRPDGTAACTDTCVIIRTTEQCATCGDGEIDEGEECDGTNVPEGKRCVDGTDALTCTPDCRLDYGACPLCGNGKVDPPLEECDYLAAVEDFTRPVECSGLSSGVSKPFTYGTTVRCLEDCKYDRAKCTFCGDGEVDGPYAPRNESNPVMLAEKCDGDAADPEALELYCRKRCTKVAVGSLVFDCNFECADNCLTFEDVPDEERDCCVPPAEACPLQGSDYKCCWELVPENAESGDDPCVDHVVGTQFSRLCK